MWVLQGDGKPTLYLCKFFKLIFPWPARFTGFATITYFCSFIFPLSDIFSLALPTPCRIPVGAVSSLNVNPINQVALEPRCPHPGMSCFIIMNGPTTKPEKAAGRESRGKRKNTVKGEGREPTCTMFYYLVPYSSFYKV